MNKKTDLVKDEPDGQLVPVDAPLYQPSDPTNDAWRKATSAPVNSVQELHLSRFLVQCALDAGASSSVIAQLLALDAKLVETVRSEMEKDGTFLRANDLHTHTREIIAAIAAVLKERVPDWQNVVLDICRKVDPDCDPAGTPPRLEINEST